MSSLEIHIARLAREVLKQDGLAVPLDYFSWGRDSRHKEVNTERLPDNPSPVVASAPAAAPAKTKAKAKQSAVGKQAASGNPVSIMRAWIDGYFANSRKHKDLMLQFRKDYLAFSPSYQLMSDDYSRNLFAELILMKLVSEKNMRLSSFTQLFIDSYEKASDMIFAASEKHPIYSRVLRKITLDHPAVSFFTVPTVLNLHLTGKLYRYQRDHVVVQVEGGDVVIDAGVGWGDTTIYLATLANQAAGGHIHAFEIQQEGMDALAAQCRLNPGINNITPVLLALSDKEGDKVNISAPGPGARVVDEATERSVLTTTIDVYASQYGLFRVNFIKMDIEGAEVPALRGAARTIQQFKPKLAISIYHKWDDLLVIPQLIHSIRNDYEYYIDCTTGFGGETVLYCR